MRIFKGLPRIAPYQNGSVLTIGNFDGVHVGHQAVISKLAGRASDLGLPTVVMLFEPQPLEFFRKDQAPPRLMRLREKVSQLAKLPVDDLVIVRFNKQLADYEAKRFIQDILVRTLNAKLIVIGDDFHFGKDRQGDFALLEAQGRQLGFAVEDTGSLQVAGQRVSSTLIRNALAEGNLELASVMLGRPYSICGRVIHGDKRGRALGFPTANLKLAKLKAAVSGVFAVTVTGIDGSVHQGVANVGSRPTVDGSKQVVLETHLLDFSQDLYGKWITINFVKKIRPEQHFKNLDELTTQIQLDVAKAKACFTAQA